MPLLADASRFEQGGWYDDYRRYPFFAARAAWVHATVPTGKLLIVGCGPGFLVDELVKLGRDAWGIDSSAYCMARAVQSARIMQADALVRSQLAAARSFAGLSGNQKFAGLVTEDLLPCLSDAEAGVAVTEARRVAPVALHIVTCSKAGDVPGSRVAELNWKTIDRWAAIVSPDRVMDTETGAVM
jgi:hypothetical protein